MLPKQSPKKVSPLIIIFPLSLLISLIIVTHLYFVKLFPPKKFDIQTIQSYKDIPGVTVVEIAIIEEIKAARQNFTYGCLLSTETFVLEDGSISGFSMNLTKLLTDLFGIPFVIEFDQWHHNLDQLKDGTIDFTHELTPTLQRNNFYYMTYPIIDRALAIITSTNSPSIKTENDIDHLRIGFLRESITAQSILNAYPWLRFEIVDLQSFQEGTEKVKNGEIDAYIAESVDSYNHLNDPLIRYQELFKLVYTPVSITTTNLELKPIISVLNKYLVSGGIDVIHELYLLGNEEYAKYQLSLLLSEQEKEYLEVLSLTSSTVPIALENDNYPKSFYNANQKMYQGIAPDILKEISKLSGICFEIKTDKYTLWTEMLRMLRTNQVALVSEVLQSPERSDYVIWSETPYLTSKFALISRDNFPDLKIPQVIRARVGVVKGTVHEQNFDLWFPNHPHVQRYNNYYEVFDDLEKGEIDLHMGSMTKLLFQMNYREKSGYKANIIFETPVEESYFGFNSNEILLKSIISKAQHLINTQQITTSWLNRTYNYSQAQARERALYTSILCFSLLLILGIFALAYIQTLKKSRLITSMKSDLEEALQKAEHATLTKSRFLATMSHEIRTPLNTIVGITLIQLQKQNLTMDYADTLKMIYNSSNILLGIINDLLDLSKIESGKMELLPLEYDLPSLIFDISQQNLLGLNAKKIAFILDIDQTLPTKLIGDEIRVKQILNNLLSNATKYTDKGFVKLAINRVDSEDELAISFRVEDSGQGIKPEDCKKLFSEYARFNINNNRHTEGTGIGLNITRNLVELMGGSIRVDSVYGKGSVFIATIMQKPVSCSPLGYDLVQQLKNFSFSRKDESPDYQIQREPMPYGKVLLVDDVKTNLYVAEGLMSLYSLQIDLASDGTEVIEKIKNGKTYDVIFMDQQMPLMDGIEATKLLREMGYQGTIVALTANALAGNNILFKQYGFDEFISKPIDIRILHTVLKKYIRDKHTSDAPPLEYLYADNAPHPKITDHKILGAFIRDAEIAIENMQLTLSAKNCQLFARSAHAMKSALGNIGEHDRAQIASQLENAGTKREYEYIANNAPVFIESLQVLIRHLHQSIATELNLTKSEEEEEDFNFLAEQLLLIIQACDQQDFSQVITPLDSLKEKKWSPVTEATIERIKTTVFLKGDFQLAKDIAYEKMKR